MINKKQTSVEFLEEALSIHFTHKQDMQFLGLFIQAKQLHKQEIIDAYFFGAETCLFDEVIDGEQYYKDNYETDN